jgi:hypothetical protein
VPFRRCSQDRRATSGHALAQRRSGNKAARHGHKITRGRDRGALPPARGDSSAIRHRAFGGEDLLTAVSLLPDSLLNPRWTYDCGHARLPPGTAGQ